MAPSFKSVLAVAGALIAPVVAQFPPAPEGLTVLKSKFNENITISFKEPGICETTPGVKSYSGYIHLPPGHIDGLGQEQTYPVNTFFWFFEARKDPENAPLSIWMNGGPGSSSMGGLLYENGPCFVNPDSNTTRLNPWSWNNEVNMLYIDQPVQVGFSYDTLRNVTRNLLGSVQTLPPGAPIPEQNVTFHVGTYPSNNRDATSQGSRNGAISLWHFAQVWFQEFPGYHPNDDRISIATQSYGGRYGPALAAFFQEQNEKIRDGTLDSGEGENYILNLDTLLLVNGCIDRKVQWPSYATMAYNNTYGIATVDEATYLGMIDAFERPGGCADQIDECQRLARLDDPENLGINANVNRVCQAAETFCSRYIRDPYIQQSGRDYYDVTQVDPTLFPDPYYAAYLNQPHKGRPFAEAGLRAAAHCALGPRLPAQISPARATCRLRASTQPGPAVPAYQPEAAYRIFMRALFNRDLATGRVDTAVKDDYSTSGPADVLGVKNEVPEQYPDYCYILDTSTCSARQIAALRNGSAVIKDYIMLEPSS
ncbi:carboxypeptidase S1 [Verticillium alfalfae VaMs.102]|uniref:Carboxypeptidase S1 n=1 Tax=Verticillium alfalfae (strain VaMs.102 / ATCC MYA-4576 / FGSC 10136) TaxID=526221 RepID=C9SNW7_VERA1|nr:carboxypeptidase S1 [Verticillium alfalfae VaMs.102]EEY20482.1 carboxypeptidase S1 [Verticillium alfalfae VaMs.102]